MFKTHMNSKFQKKMFKEFVSFFITGTLEAVISSPFVVLFVIVIIVVTIVVLIIVRKRNKRVGEFPNKVLNFLLQYNN